MRRECHATSSGYTLIEVLITMLVLAVGVLGAAGLQVTALKNLQTSGSYGTAAMLANDMADRMWINRAQVLADAYNHSEAPAGTIPDCDANVCSGAQMAVYDTNEWQQLVTGYTQAGTDIVVPSMLQSGQGEVTRPVNTEPDFEITLRWDDDNSGSTGTECPPQSADDLDCYTLTVSF